MRKKQQFHLEIALKGIVVVGLFLASFIYLSYGGLTGQATGIFDEKAPPREETEFNTIDSAVNSVVAAWSPDDTGKVPANFTS
ncbi:MAG TPA: hypothetical protein VJI15_03925 [Candidatus Nanoarchaeia archaeon]|nr:hypothetical protein [Candidatus Nanoarchaeia archaeon]